MVLVCRTLVILCLLATITSALHIYPHQLAYFNEAAGGPENGYKHMLHSNLDGGQDLLLVREWMQAEKIESDKIFIVSQYPLLDLLLRKALTHQPHAKMEIVSLEEVVKHPDRWYRTRSPSPPRKIGYTFLTFLID